jgi:predicted  nucleic acid-binding Zn-ribbon protein
MTHIDNIEAELSDIEIEIADIISSGEQVKGAINSNMKRLKDEFGLKSIKDATDEVKRIKNEIIKVEKRISSGMEELREMRSGNE